MLRFTACMWVFDTKSIRGKAIIIAITFYCQLLLVRGSSELRADELEYIDCSSKLDVQYPNATEKHASHAEINNNVPYSSPYA